MMDTGTPTLDQLRVLATVVEAGSFSAAARRLHRAQSVISYTVANLEAQLGVALFERDGRRPVLTEAGRALIADARRVGRLVDELRARAAGAAPRGWRPRLGLAVDVMFPTARLVAALEAFRPRIPDGRRCGCASRRWAGWRAGAGRHLRPWHHRAAGHAPEALERRPLCQIELIPVAAPTHPLARRRR